MRISLALIRRALLLGIAFLLVTATGALAATGWQAPLRPLTVTRPFEQPPTPYAAGHRGVDLGGVPGQRVLAAAAGVVSFAGPLAGRGVVVVVHGALRTTYEPVLAIVRVGAQVTGGQQIGLLQPGHPDCPATACLHWGLLRGDTYLDPLSVLSARRVRLLPPAGEVKPAGAGSSRAAPLEAAVLPAPGLSPGVRWSVAGVAGAGVVMLRRRR